jgi:hypothetical protein
VAVESALRIAPSITFQTWQHFDEVLTTWIEIWPAGREDQKQRMLVAAVKEV